MNAFHRVVQAFFVLLALVLFFDATLPGAPGLIPHRGLGLAAAALSVVVVGLREWMHRLDESERARRRGYKARHGL